MPCQSIFRIKIQDDLPFFHSTIIVINGVKCKVLYLIKKIKSCLGWRNRHRLYSNFLHARFRPISSVPALILSRLLSPRRQYNPVKFLPMECGQMPTGEGRSHFMMQYYAYILMFVVFDVMAIFLYAWGTALFNIPRAAHASSSDFLQLCSPPWDMHSTLQGEKGFGDIANKHYISM